jgi:CRISPR-associated endonuclease/helicase Cas3
MYLSHSKNDFGESHLLVKHLKEVALEMESWIVNPEFKHLFYVTGLLHDFGKFQDAFQKYLTTGGKRGSVPHAAWGAALAIYYKQYEAAFAIDGHHKGLPDKADLKDDCNEFLETEHQIFMSIKEVFLNEAQVQERFLEHMPLQLESTERELLIRYLFSSLTDADWLNTEKHFSSNKAAYRIVPEFDPEALFIKLEEEVRSKSKEGYINQLRNKVRNYAIGKADNPIGFYSMTLPTGMGKTFSSISWALKHAGFNKLRRLIIVLPFISIIDQTAKELKRIFGDEWVLEHHSSFNEDEDTHKDIAEESQTNDVYSKRLATENWDYPIIVTTTVQFFESLFANKPARCRKIHNIAESVVIFDEVQTLPKELVLPTLSMLRDIHKIMGTSFLFCTATQPAFEKTERFNGIEEIIPLVENPKEVFEATKRVNYFSVNLYKYVDINELAKKVIEKGVSVLTILNTKKNALQLYKKLVKISDWMVFHLSTSMYPTHRKRTIENIRKCLENKNNILVVSTQLIEAGVDFDFPCVFREIAPLESIIQSAGRCNREGKMDEPGEVYIFSMEERPRPMKQYYSLADYANTLYKENEALLFEHDFYSEYYQKAFQLFIPEDKFNIELNRKGFNFIKVSESYRLIDTSTTPVFILCDESREFYENIRHKPFLSRNDYRVMQLYSVQVYANFLRENSSNLSQEPQGYWLWHGEYREEYGLCTENPLMII